MGGLGGVKEKSLTDAGLQKALHNSPVPLSTGDSHTKEKLHISHTGGRFKRLRPCSPPKPHKKDMIKVTSVEKI